MEGESEGEREREGGLSERVREGESEMEGESDGVKEREGV